MLKSYFKSAMRSLFRNKAHSLINIAGLSVGMAVSMMIGLWIWDELSFNKYHQHYHRIAQVMQQQTFNEDINTSAAIPLPLDAEMRRTYGSDFKHIVMSSWTDPHILAADDKKISCAGNFMGADAPEMFSLKMIRGSRNGLEDPSSLIISQSVAKSIFGETDPMNKSVLLDNKVNFKIAGVYEDLPPNSSLNDVAFIAPWEFFVHAKDWIQRDPNNWDDNSLFMYVQVADRADMDKISAKIKHAKLDKVGPDITRSKPLLFLQPMSKWHLYNEFKQGINTGGAIQYVWLFGIIGLFVLLLACINFMNLSTASSEKRAKEVGIRKAIGSARLQLISQFFCESVLIASCALCFSVILVLLALPFFNTLSGKNMVILWNKPGFWLISAGFTLFTGLVAGSYPALYLSSLRPVKVLKGSYKAGKLEAIPRKVLVVLQFAVSVILIIGTIIVFQQIKFAKERPVGYSRDGLIAIETTNDDLIKQFQALRTDLLNVRAIAEMAGSSSPTTSLNNNRNDLDWKGKDPAMTPDFGNIKVTSEYGKTVGWNFTEGRDFSARLISDSSAIILNETAVKYMGIKHPLGEIIRVGRRNLMVIGVVKDMLVQSPYEPVKQTIYSIGRGSFDNILIKINPTLSIHEAIQKITAVCKSYSPSVPFTYKFADEEYAKKFGNEERIGKLAGCFATLAIFISCLGLFGMASFMASQRIKEIGVRKVLGASVFNLWRQMSKEFVLLIIISLLIAIPMAYYLMSNWLMNYAYHAAIPWWIFAGSGLGAILITLITVSYQSIKAARMDPVKCLRTE